MSDRYSFSEPSGTHSTKAPGPNRVSKILDYIKHNVHDSGWRRHAFLDQLHLAMTGTLVFGLEDPVLFLFDVDKCRKGARAVDAIVKLATALLCKMA